jgi:DNA-binding IclR family transcriptional regulator
LGEAAEPIRPADIAPEARMKAANVRQLLRSMVAAGEVKKVKTGWYAHLDHTDHTDHTSRAGHA